MSSAPPTQSWKTPSQSLARATSLNDAMDRDGGQRGPGRRFPDHRVAADGCEHGIPRPDRDREVERRDDPDGSQRVPLFEHPVPGAFAGDRQAIELARQADREVAHVDHLLDFALAFGADLPRLEGHQQSEVGLVSAEGHTDLTDHLAPPRRRDHPPAPERFVRPVDHPVILLDRGRAHPGHRLARRRIDRADHGRSGPWRLALDRHAGIDLADPQPGEQVVEHRIWPSTTPVGIDHLARPLCLNPARAGSGTAGPAHGCGPSPRG